MNSSIITFTGDWAFHGLVSDLAVDFSMLPYHRIGFKIDAAGIQKLADHYRERVFRAFKWFGHQKLSWTILLLRFDRGAFLIAHGDGRDYAEIFASSADEVTAIHDEVRQILHGSTKPKLPVFYMLRYDSSDFSADPIENLPDMVSDEFLQLCYGDDIVAWITQFSERTRARAGGLTILDGPPGTGKTSLITQLIRRLEQTHVFYSLTASQDAALCSPELVPFWQRQNARHADRVKVIVMEDAERLLWRRNGDNREAVSSLLNIADGLLGRMLRLHVICSVNARMEDLDPAVLRPGRLMNHRRFETLSRETALQVAAARDIAFRPRETTERYTLAEVLNPGSYEPPKPRPRIGFQNHIEI
jgi:ATPase family associated with various cellular activities (AAA)